MAHRALALKYRPQVFSDLVGQDHVSEVLARAVESGRIAHAYLFTGARGVGKTTSARILAKALNCERRGTGKKKPGQSAADPCNECTSCTEITAGVSLDVAEIDGASNRGIADVQALREKVRFTPTGGRYRVVIIDEVHQLSNDAFAALLKTLEEPPPHLVFIFATTDPQKLPDTIRSRTQRFDFARVPLRKVAARLHTIAEREAQDPEGLKFTLDEGAGLLIAHKSEGSMRDAVSALDQVLSSGETKIDEAVVRRVLGIADREAFFTLADAITKRDPKAALAALNQAFTKGLDPRDLAEGLGEHIRHLLILKVDPGAEDLVAASADDLVRLRAQTEGWSEHDLLRLLRLATESLWPMRESPQPLIHLEAAVLQMATLEPGETLAEILHRLEALERRLGGSAPGPAAGSGSGTRTATGVREVPAYGGGTASRTGSASAPRPPASGGRGPAPRSTPMMDGAPSAPVVVAAPVVATATVAGPTPVMATATVIVTAPAVVSTPVMATAPAVAPAPVIAPAPRTTTGSATAVVEDDGPRLDAETLALWQQVIGAVNAQKRMLGAFLEESQFLGLLGDALIVGTDDLHRSVLDESENRARVTTAASSVFGRPMTVRYTRAQNGAPKPPVMEDVRPMIDRAIAWFEGDVIERPGRGSERTEA